MTYVVTNEVTGETTKFTNKRKVEKFQRDIVKMGQYSNLYIFDGDRRIS